MTNRTECLCQLDENHPEIGCFFKYVIFLLKRFVSSRDQLTMDPKDAHAEIFKNDIWMQIATQYDGYFTDCDCESSCADGCVLESLQKSTQNQLKMLTSKRRGTHKFNMEHYHIVLQRGAAYNGNFPDLTHILFLLELIVANPPLFDKNHPSFGDAEFKFKVWNEICAAWYKRDQSYYTNFNFQCRFAEQLLHRISNPLNVNRSPETNERVDLNDEVSAIANGKSVPRLVLDVLGGDGTEAAALHIENVEKLFVITNNKHLNDATPTNSTPAPPPPPPPPTKEKKKKYRRHNRNQNAEYQANQHADTQPQLNNHDQES